uniref:Uncharacterized protein n=1 Tax=Arundo donax TaxID=35708 RepID=A0A0A9GR90_ARUDO
MLTTNQSEIKEVKKVK